MREEKKNKNMVIHVEINESGEIVDLCVPGREVTVTKGTEIKGSMNHVTCVESLQLVTVNKPNPGNYCRIIFNGQRYCFPC